MTLLKASGVQKQFVRGGNAIDVLGRIDLEIEPKDRIAVIGKSGAGKSTLLHILGTLEAPTSGRVEFEGQDVFALSEEALSVFRNRHLGFIFQFHYLMLEFTALENVMMPALIGGFSRGEAREKAMQLLDRVGLSHRVEHKPNQLSGGEQQRVSIARAIMMHPKLLLTDEMTGNLDPVTGMQVFELILELQDEYKMAIVSVTHDSKLASTYQKIYQLREGALHRVNPS